MESFAGERPNLNQAVARLDAIIQNSPSVAIQSFDRHGTIRLWNPASETLYGYSAGQALGKKVQQLLLAPADVEGFERKLEHIVATKTACEPQEWETLTAT